MLLWIAFALLTAVVLAAVLAPLARPARQEEGEGEADAGTVAVYRHQLTEVEAERARGLIGDAEAEAAKLEISRRLLASAARNGVRPLASDVAAEPSRGGEGSDPVRPQPVRALLEARHANIALGTAVAIPLLTLGLYLMHGSPGMPSASQARTEAAKAEANLADLIAKVEARLRQAPEDGKGWEVVAPVYLKLGRYRDAATAYANAVRLQGESVPRLAGLAEASLLANNGLVTEQARGAYERILKIEPGRVEARFWLAMAKEQDGRLADALAEYRSLLKESPAEAPYRAPLELRIKEVSARMATAASGKAPGPTAADMEAAAKLAPEQQAQMIAAMVDGLAQRLKANGKDLAGWMRLLNAYSVLGRKEEARAALAEARRNFDGDQHALSELSQLATTLGLGS